jgi:glycosyltransferase involved in cell wall biosynthesis
VKVRESHEGESKNILVITYGPVPTPEFQKIEGGGMRCWGIATGLRDNGHNVTVSVFSEFKQNLETHKGINLHNWSLNDDFKAFINSFDAVVVSYNMGDASMFVADNITDEVTLVLDCYVPIYIEISARNSDDKAGELRGYLPAIESFNHVLRRGDFFLCANAPQKHMYMGILGSLGVINPYTYHDQRVLVVPFGVDAQESRDITGKNPYKAKDDDFVLLWFGGLYPWFNFEPLIKAVTELSKNPHFKFYLVGGKNPYNGHPDFVRQYDHVLEKFTELGLLDKSVYFVEWIDFDDRMRWFAHANSVISINSPGEENVYSWRTRIMDYLGGELPMISNGGDPLSDEIIAAGAGLQTSGTSEDIVKIVTGLIQKPETTHTLRTELQALRKQYHWDRVTKSLSDAIVSDNSHPYSDTLQFMREHKITGGHIATSQSTKLQKHAMKLQSYAVRARQKGLKRSAKFAAGAVFAQLKSSSVGRMQQAPKTVFLSHPIDHTGAPLVLLDIVDDFSKHVPHGSITIVAPSIERDLLRPLLSHRYKMRKMAMGIGGRFIQASLQINPDDFVLVNTTALYQNYKDYIYWMLETGKLNHAYWFIHEDKPKTQFKNDHETMRIKRLISQKKLTVLVSSHQTAEEYDEFLATDTVQPITLRVQVPDEYTKPRVADDFDTIRFLISGRPLDGRKGQLLFLAGLQLFETMYRSKVPDQYRDYTLDLIAIGDDYVSEQIKSIGTAFLGDRLNVHPVVDHETALDITSSCNVTVCCSLNESFAIYVAEGMLMGHPVLRNKASGWQEQVQDGKNGFEIPTDSVQEIAGAIRKILDKKLSNKELASMGLRSQKIASDFVSANYYQQIMRKQS